MEPECFESRLPAPVGPWQTTTADIVMLIGYKVNNN
jgi:hypothetical protein